MVGVSLACLMARSDGKEMGYVNSDFLSKQVGLPLPDWCRQLR